MTPSAIQIGNAVEASSDVATFHLRHGTQDYAVFTDVLAKNQYRLPDQFPSDSIVIDVGANVGAFAVACLLRGAGTVVCFEPCPFNFQQLLLNTKPWFDEGRVSPLQAAVWRSDRNEKIDFIGDRRSTACGGVLPSTTRNECGDYRMFVESIGLDDLLFHVTDGGKARIHTLKIDAEGSEYPILYTSRHLDMIDNLLVETHQCDTIWPQDNIMIAGYSKEEACADGMASFLRSKDFIFTTESESMQNSICTIFFAKSRRENDTSKT